ncbi:MAG TPA: 2-amino-3,7-dideoxy-D-threo-hept-6-ulosonate synthase [Candidatus Thermoplasmatota archaeon]|nr:2-amino-3,7-dideoxy-D-threo-hept-6-ulosonate synthase [Candidatus Thermoplasmatota archaeon]
MTSLGKRLRLQRLIDPGTGRAVIIPLDHGISIGPVEGVIDLPRTIRAVTEGGATGLVMHKGLVRAAAPALTGRAGLMVHLSASTDLNPDPNEKVLVGTVEEAVRLGADGISIHVNIGAPRESRMVEDAGRIATECERLGMPLLAMMYPRGHEIRNPHDVKFVKHVARVGAELGADLVKCPYTGSVESFRQVVEGCAGVPVLISGGPKIDSDVAFLETVHAATQAGAAGVSVGRNIWQHRNVRGMTRAIADIVMNNATVDEAQRHLKG